MSKVDRKTAEADLESFMTAFKLDTYKRSILKGVIEKCTVFIMDGLLVVNDNHLEYTLLESIESSDGKETIVEKLIFKNRRLRVDEIDKIDKGESVDTEKMYKMISLMTGVNPLYIPKMTGDDLAYAGVIASFFTPVQ